MMKKTAGMNGCTGCSACEALCPNDAIQIKRNREGFWEACLDAARCTGCGMCGEVCHLMQEQNGRRNRRPVFYAAYAKDRENVEKSSSGGIFYELCKAVLKEGGVVYGAAWESVREVAHRRAETAEEAAGFRRSKYLESRMGNCLERARQDLEQGRPVLFSGVGCQIAGLYGYLQKEYENLYTCEAVCHGIPSHLAYEAYLDERKRQTGSGVCELNFRDKSLGWKENAVCETLEDGSKSVIPSRLHPLHAVYLKGINLRGICGLCKYARLPRTADLSLADFWQYQGGLTETNADRGISLIAVNNDQGEFLFKKIKDFVFWEGVGEEAALKSCRHMSQSPVLYKSQEAFFKMLQRTGFGTAAAVCSEFGPVIRAAELCQVREPYESGAAELCEARLLEAFGKDRQELVYVLDTQDRVKGVVTYGDFLRNYENQADWVNTDFQRVILSEGCARIIRELFKTYRNINRIPIVDPVGILLFEVRRSGAGPVPSRLDAAMLEAAKKYRELFGRAGLASPEEIELVEPFLRLCAQGIETYWIERPELLPDYPYTEDEKKRIQNQDSFPRLSEDIAGNEAVLKELFQERFAYSYIEELRRMPQIVEKNGRYQHVDHASKLIHVTGGCRRTCGQPSEYDRTVHVYGRCGAFGYAVEDADTIPSALQRLFMENGQKIRVVNHGLWGADDRMIIHNLSMDLWEGVIGQRDKVVLYMGGLPCMERLRSLNLYVWDSTRPFHAFIKGKTVFYDKPGHMTAEGYRYMADRICQELAQPAHMAVDKERRETLSEFLRLYERAAGPKTHREADRTESAAGTSRRLKQNGLKAYSSKIQREVPYRDGIKRGAIVMNCNPFTKGHRYLIETAAGEVDELFIFVVEEDRSFFPFRDRLEMVRRGTKDLKHVHVLRGGQFMISALTFPEYFIKEQAQELKINPTSDIQTFAGEIAPALHISVRFAGTEPRDGITRQYNEAMRELLPVYGIRFREIERIKQGEEVVSATDVRRALGEGDEKRLRELVPETTLLYLKERGYLKGKDTTG